MESTLNSWKIHTLLLQKDFYKTFIFFLHILVNFRNVYEPIITIRSNARGLFSCNFVLHSEKMRIFSLLITQNVFAFTFPLFS